MSLDAKLWDAVVRHSPDEAVLKSLSLSQLGGHEL
jgi:hypothetical protein